MHRPRYIGISSICRDLDEHVSHLLVSLGAREESHADRSISLLLDMVRLRLKLRVVFIAQFEGGRRVFRLVSAAPGTSVFAAGDSSPTEESWCQCIVTRTIPRIINDTSVEPSLHNAPALPIAVGSHIGTPIVLSDGTVYGTICGYSEEPSAMGRHHLGVFTHTAQLIADTVERCGAPFQTLCHSMPPRPQASKLLQ